MKQEIKNLIQEVALAVQQAAKSENSSLISDIRKNIAILEVHYQDIKCDLTDIKVQTTRTNGRVSKLEGWRSLLIGGWSVVTLIVIPLLCYIFFNAQQNITEKIDIKVQDGIRTALSTYNITVE